MRSHRRLILSVGIALSMVSCKATSQIGGAQAKEHSAQELAVFRTKVPTTNTYEQFEKHSSQLNTVVSHAGEPVTSKEHINNALSYKLTMLKENRANIAETMGYRILIYSGNNVQEANKLASRVREVFEKQADITFLSPNYTVKVGSYISRLKAHEDYSSLKAEFTQAVIVSERVRIPR
jgi:hypothetical protein